MRTQRKFHGTPFATSLRRRPSGTVQLGHFLGSWSAADEITKAREVRKDAICFQEWFYMFWHIFALVSFACVSEDIRRYWKSKGFSTTFCYWIALARSETRRPTMEVGWLNTQTIEFWGEMLLGVLWQMGNHMRSHPMLGPDLIRRVFTRSFSGSSRIKIVALALVKNLYLLTMFRFFWHHVPLRHRSYVTEFFCTAALQPKFQLSSLTTYYIPEDRALASQGGEEEFVQRFKIVWRPNWIDHYTMSTCRWL